MSVCGAQEADKIGTALTEFFIGMNDVAKENNETHVAASAEEDCDDILATKKKLDAKKATKTSTMKEEREIADMPLPPPHPPPPATISPPLIHKKKQANLLFSPRKISMIDVNTNSHGSPRNVIEAASKEFEFIRDGSADSIFRLHTQWDDMKQTVEMKEPADQVSFRFRGNDDNMDKVWIEEEIPEFIGDVSIADVGSKPYTYPRVVFVRGSSAEQDDSSVATCSSNISSLSSEQKITEETVKTSHRYTSLKTVTPAECIEVSKSVQRRKKNIKKILEKSRSGLYDGQCQTSATTHTKTGRNSSLADRTGTQIMSEIADNYSISALGAPQNFHIRNVEDAGVSAGSRNEAPLDITEGQQERSRAVDSNNEVVSKPAISFVDEDESRQPTRELQQAQGMRIKTINEYIAKIDHMKGELMRDIEWQKHKQAQITKIQTMEEYVGKIDSMKGQLVQEIKCMKAKLQITSIEDSNEKKKSDEAELIVYQLSCRKCKRNQTSYIGRSSLDIKTTIDRHFYRVVKAVQCKGKDVRAFDSNESIVEEEWSNDFAMHFARHCQPRFGSKKTKEEVFNFCIANAKVEVLGNDDMIYGCNVDGKVTASAASPRVCVQNKVIE